MSRPRVPAGAAAILLAALLTCSGCLWHRPLPEPRMPEGVSWRTTPEAVAPQRIGVLPFYLGVGVGRAGTTINDNLPAALRELGVAEVISVGVDTRDRLLKEDVLLANRVRSEDLLRLHDALSIDSVLIGRVEQFDSYDPISISLSAHLISCRDGTVQWSVTGHFDGRRADVQQDIQAWHARANGAANPALGGWKQVLQSPRLFTRYVADRVVSTIR